MKRVLELFDGGIMRFFFILSVLIIVILCNLSSLADADTCYGSTGGDGNTYLEVTVTAGGNPVEDIYLYLQPKTYTGGDAYETPCSNSSGKGYFKLETNPSKNCFSSYTDYKGVTRSYCSPRSAHCYQYCYGSSLFDSWYSSKTLATENYFIEARPPYGSSIADRYGTCRISDINLDFNSSQSVSCEVTEKSELLRVKVLDDNDKPITSSLNIYLGSTSSYLTKEVVASTTDFYVIPDERLTISAGCKDSQNCKYRCVSNKVTSVSAAEGTKTITLKAKESNATITGQITGSDGSVLQEAYVSMYTEWSGETSDNESCYAYGYAQTDSNGSYSLSMPAGTYNVSANPKWVDGGYPYAGKNLSATLASSETATKNFVLVKKDKSITATVKDDKGNLLQNAYVSAYSYDKEDTFSAWSQSNAQGVAQIAVLDGKHNVFASYWSAETNDSSRTMGHCPTEGAQAVTAPADISFTFPVLDHTMNIMFVDESNNLINDISGGVSIRPAETKGWCSDWASIENGNTRKLVGANATWHVQGWVYGGTSYVPKELSVECTAGASGSSSTGKIPMVAMNKTLKGNFVDGDGNILDLSDQGYLYVSVNRGPIWQTATVTDTGYSAAVSTGLWSVNPWSGWNNEYVSRAVTTLISIKESDTVVQQDLMYLATGKIEVTLEPAQKWAWMEATVFRADEFGKKDEERRYYYNNGCSTNSEGKCTITVASKRREKGGLKYYVNLHRPMDAILEDGRVSNGEFEVLTYAGETVTANVTTRTLDADINVNILVAADAVTNVSKGVARINPIKNSSATTEEDLKNDAFVSCFSDLGGATEATSSDGVAMIKATSGDIWHCFAVNELGQKIYISEEGEITVNAGTNEMNLKLNYVTDISENYSATWDASVANTIKLANGYTEIYPALSLAESGMVTCSVQETARLPYLAAKRPAAITGFDSVCNDENGNEIKTMRSNFTLCMPLNTNQLEKLDLTADDIQFTYYDPSSGTYVTVNDAAIDSTTGIACAQLDHKTEFALIGNGNLTGVDGDSEDAAGEAERTGETGSGALGGSGCGCRVGATSQTPQTAYFFVFAIAVLILMRRQWKRVTVRPRNKDDH